MYEEEYVLEALVHILNGWLSFWYGDLFLRRKFVNRRKAAIIWITVYVVGQILYGRLVEAYPLYDRFTHVVPYILLLSLLQYFFFEKNLPRQVFVVGIFVSC